MEKIKKLFLTLTVITLLTTTAKSQLDQLHPEDLASINRTVSGGGAIVKLPEGNSFVEVTYKTLLDSVNNGTIAGSMSFYISPDKVGSTRKMVLSARTINEIYEYFCNDMNIIIEYDNFGHLISVPTSFIFSFHDDTYGGHPGNKSKILDISWVFNTKDLP